MLRRDRISRKDLRRACLAWEELTRRRRERKQNDRRHFVRSVCGPTCGVRPPHTRSSALTPNIITFNIRMHSRGCGHPDVHSYGKLNILANVWNCWGEDDSELDEVKTRRAGAVVPTTGLVPTRRLRLLSIRSFERLVALGSPWISRVDAMEGIGGGIHSGSSKRKHTLHRHHTRTGSTARSVVHALMLALNL